MSSFLAVRGWFTGLTLRFQAGVLIGTLMVVAASVFGLMPHDWLLTFNAFLSGMVWLICVGILVFGGHRVDVQWYAGAAFIAAGLTTSIPSLYYEETPVAWGSTLSRLGVLIWAVSTVHHLYVKYREEREA